MDGRCATCKHWRQGDELRHLRTMDGEFKFFRYAHVNDGDGPLKRAERAEFRPCDLTEYEGSSYDTPSKALAVDAEDYYACLYTAPDFGCVQWEPKPPPSPAPKEDQN